MEHNIWTMKTMKKERSTSASIAYVYDDEERGTYIGVPVRIMNEDKDSARILLQNETKKKKTNQKISTFPFYFPWTCYFISSIQIVTFTLLISMYGFTSRTSNPFLGPPLAVIDAWGSKNPYHIIHNHQYWRVLSALFFNVGLMDLFFSVGILFCLGYHLERRWGVWKLMLVYLFSGISGNIFSTFTSPNAISVGSGGSIFGILGAINIEIIYSILVHSKSHQHQNDNVDSNDQVEEGDGTDDDEDEDDEEKVNNKINETEEDSNDIQEDLFIFHSTFIVLGFFGGIMISTLIGFIAPTASVGYLAKDWSVLYGGMISGMIMQLCLYLYKSAMTVRNKNKESMECWREFAVLILIIAPFVLDSYFAFQLSRRHNVFLF